jgi:hypothetical protein
MLSSGGVQVYTMKGYGKKEEEDDQFVMIVKTQSDEGRGYLAPFTATSFDDT